ncbi:MAG: hypothetical protein ACP5XB_30020, partial [Isosphaeraceae bacterium]
MRQAFSIAITLIAFALPIRTLRAQDKAGRGALDQARSLVKQGAYEKAAATIEDALPASKGDERGAMLDLLGQVYRNLISQADAEGKPAVAREYREYLDIISPSVGGQRDNPIPKPAAPAPAKLEEFPAIAAPAEDQPPHTPVPSAPAAASTTDGAIVKTGLQPLPRARAAAESADLHEPSPLADPGPMPPPLDGPAQGKPEAKPEQPKPDAQPNVPASPSSNAPPKRTGPTGQAHAIPPPTRYASALMPAPAAELAQADRLFTSKKYEDAGRIYARLAARSQLPPQRKQVWAYCRWVAVVARINASPRSDREWDEIEQEIRGVQRLVPGNWYGEYLQNRAAEARRATGRSGKLVVRGSAPEENPPRRFPRLLGRSRTRPTAPQPADKAVLGEQALALPSPADQPEAARNSVRGPRSAGVNAETPAPAGPVAAAETS